MLQTTSMKIPPEIPQDEAVAIATGDYKALNKRKVMIGLSEEALRLLQEEAEIYQVNGRTKALEILLRERREARKRRKK